MLVALSNRSSRINTGTSMSPISKCAGPIGEPIQLPKARACNVNAFNHSLIGRAFWNKQTESGFKTAITHFENCLADDAAYAKAYLGMADCYRKLEFWGTDEPR
jgi:hypothetical protein